MNRREALRTIGSGATLGAVAAAALVTVQCQPVEAPAAEADPLLVALTTYRRQLAEFNNSPLDMSDEENDALRDETWGPLFERVSADPSALPAATTLAGAVMALRVLIEEQNLFEFDDALARAALAYFDGETV